MYNNENTIKLFDSNNNFVSDFDEKIEEIEKSMYGDNYYDTDQELEDTRVVPTKVINEEVKTNDEIKINKVEIKENKPKKTKKVSFKDFVPVIFFILLFAIIIYAGYYFLNNFDISGVING